MTLSVEELQEIAEAIRRDSTSYAVVILLYREGANQYAITVGQGIDPKKLVPAIRDLAKLVETAEVKYVPPVEE
jgi:hypothetical protein